MSAAFALAQSAIAGTVCNLGNCRSQSASVDVRTEGWTETWGNAAVVPDLKDPAATSCRDAIRAIDDESICNALATAHPQTEIAIFQYRPAWFEQAVLRMAGVPFVVRNSSYQSTEATGPLPFLRDIRPAAPPVLVGRHQRNVKGYQANAILQYLMRHRGVDLDGHLDKATDAALSRSFSSLISSDLADCLAFLRYKDADAWAAVHRKAHMGATSPNADGVISHLGGRFQAWSERAMALHRISTDAKFDSIEEATEKASECYEAIEAQLSSHDAPFLLGHPRPSLVDADLFAHLADALCDLHLVVALASFPKTLGYFERAYSEYFSIGTHDALSAWNAQQNHLNAFQRLPVNPGSGALLREGVRESVQEAARIRSGEPWPKVKVEESTWYRWRMGDLSGPNAGVDAEAKAAAAAPENPIREKMKKEQVRNDQVWISAVVGTSILALFLLQKPNGKK